MQLYHYLIFFHITYTVKYIFDTFKKYIFFVFIRAHSKREDYFTRIADKKRNCSQRNSGMNITLRYSFMVLYHNLSPVKVLYRINKEIIFLLSSLYVSCKYCKVKIFSIHILLKLHANNKEKRDTLI